VLVADGNPDTADSLAILVQLWGHDVRVSYDGVAALETAFAYLPDVVLLELAMPKIDGCRLAQKLRRKTRFRNTFLIAITGHADEGHRQLGKEAGFDLYLIKPVKPSILETLLLLERERLAGRLSFGRGRVGYRETSRQSSMHFRVPNAESRVAAFSSPGETDLLKPPPGRRC
jgi:DNA-binding response OmpR family regulator